MSKQKETLLCWHSERAGTDVLDNAIKALKNRRIEIDYVLYIIQSGRKYDIPPLIGQAEIETIEVELDDPTHHAKIYNQVSEHVLPRLRNSDTGLHVNISPGTPAMHSIWLILHAGGRFPKDTKIWSSQVNRKTKRPRIDPVEFSINTYLAEIHQYERTNPDIAVYETEARSEKRRSALEQLQRYAKVADAPLLVLGERGTGKTRLVESIVESLKGNKKVVPVTCGGLDSELADSLLFGHKKGAFTGATEDRSGLLAKANKGILFLDEIQDLPKSAQRNLVRLFQGHRRHYRPVGGDEEITSDLELVCASNLPVSELRERLDADFFDRISHLTVTIPPLRECRDDIKEDWQRVWREIRQQEGPSEKAPWTPDLENTLRQDPLPGNLRDLQRLALLCIAWWDDSRPDNGLEAALREWQQSDANNDLKNAGLGEGSRKARIRYFQARLAQWAKGQYGTWKSAAAALECDEKTLREDAGRTQ